MSMFNKLFKKYISNLLKMDKQIVKYEPLDILHKETIEAEKKSSIPSKLEGLEACNIDTKSLTDTEFKIYQINYNILNILSSAAMKEAEKVSCQHSCKGAQQVYTNIMENVFKPK